MARGCTEAQNADPGERLSTCMGGVWYRLVWLPWPWMTCLDGHGHRNSVMIICGLLGFIVDNYGDGQLWESLSTYHRVLGKVHEIFLLVGPCNCLKPFFEDVHRICTTTIQSRFPLRVILDACTWWWRMAADTFSANLWMQSPCIDPVWDTDEKGHMYPTDSNSIWAKTIACVSSFRRGISCWLPFGSMLLCHIEREPDGNCYSAWRLKLWNANLSLDKSLKNVITKHHASSAAENIPTAWLAGFLHSQEVQWGLERDRPIWLAYTHVLT